MKISCGNYFAPFRKIDIRHELHVDDKEPQVKLEGLNTQGVYVYIEELDDDKSSFPAHTPEVIWSTAGVKSLVIETFPPAFRILFKDGRQAWIKVEKEVIELSFSKKDKFQPVKTKHLKTETIHIPKAETESAQTRP